MTHQTSGRFARWGPALTRLATAAFVTSAGALAGAVYLATGNAAVVDSSTTGVELFWAFGWIGFGIVGLILVSKRPSKPLGWVLLGIPGVVYASLFLAEYAVRGLVVAPGSLPLAVWAGWVGKWLFVLGIGLVLGLVMLFPDEVVQGRRMRRIARLMVVLVAVETVVIAVEPGPVRGDLHGEAVMNPVGLTVFGDAPTVMAGIVGAMIAVVGLVIVVNAVVRWWRATGVRRQQFRWFASAVVAFPVLFTATDIERVNHLLGWDPAVLAVFFGMNGVAAAIGIAITRYRLYEIDRVISRTVSYALLTVALIGIYGVGVIVLGSAVRAVTGGGGGDVVVAASTLGVAAAFGPLRRRVQALVDRRFNRSRYDARTTVEVFGQRLRDEVELSRLAQDLQAVVTEAVRPVGISLWLPPTEAGEAT
jgi:hypothetical protein